MFRIGERVYITSDDKFNPIPQGAIGFIEEHLGDNLYEVKFEGYPHNNPYKDEFCWTMHENELGSFEPLRAVNEPLPSFDTPMLRIPIPDGTEELTGDFQDSQGTIYRVTVERRGDLE